MSEDDYKNMIDCYNKIANKYETGDDSFEVFDLLAKELGIISINRNSKKFDIRGENTPSATCYANLTYVDFGAGKERKNIIHLLREKDPLLSFSKAVIKLADLLNQNIDDLKAQALVKVEKKEIKKEEPYSEYYIQKQVKDRNLIENKEIFLELVSGLCRSCSIEEKRRAVKIFNIGINKTVQKIQKEENGEIKEYENEQVRLFIPEYDHNKVPYGSFRYNRAITENKGLLRKNGQRVLFGSHLLKLFDKNKPIIFSEGHSDTVVNNAKGLQCLTSGSSTQGIKNFLPLLEGFELHFFPDADQPGIKGVTEKIYEIEVYNKELPQERKIKYKVLFWGLWEEKTIKAFESLLIPMSEIDTVQKYKSVWWKKYITDENIAENVTFDILEKEQEKIWFNKNRDFKTDILLPEEGKIKKWKLLSRDIMNQGFDFIDFHMKHQNTDAYNKFIDKYKYDQI